MKLIFITLFSLLLLGSPVHAGVETYIVEGGIECAIDLPSSKVTGVVVATCCVVGVSLMVGQRLFCAPKNKAVQGETHIQLSQPVVPLVNETSRIVEQQEENIAENNPTNVKRAESAESVLSAVSVAKEGEDDSWLFADEEDSMEPVVQ